MLDSRCPSITRRLAPSSSRVMGESATSSTCRVSRHGHDRARSHCRVDQEGQTLEQVKSRAPRWTTTRDTGNDGRRRTCSSRCSGVQAREIGQPGFFRRAGFDAITGEAQITHQPFSLAVVAFGDQRQSRSVGRSTRSVQPTPAQSSRISWSTDTVARTVSPRENARPETMVV